MENLNEDLMTDIEKEWKFTHTFSENEALKSWIHRLIDAGDAVAGNQSDENVYKWKVAKKIMNLEKPYHDEPINLAEYQLDIDSIEHDRYVRPDARIVIKNGQV
jgi:hypothetical protein